MPRPLGPVPLVVTSGSTVGPPGPAGPPGTSSTGVAFSEVMINASDFSTNSSSPTRAAGRTLDMTPYPPTLGSLTRHVKFIATLESTTGSVLCSVRLYDVTHSVVVTGSALDNSAAVDRTLPFDATAILTVGGASGDVRDDVVTQYEVQITMTGGSPSSDRAICVDARLVISYS